MQTCSDVALAQIPVITPQFVSNETSLRSYEAWTQENGQKLVSYYNELGSFVRENEPYMMFPTFCLLQYTLAKRRRMASLH